MFEGVDLPPEGDIMVEPKRTFAIVGRYADAISDARKNGCTWKELLVVLAPVIGVRHERILANAYRRAARAIESGRISPKQLPLPMMGEEKTSSGGVTKRLIAEKKHDASRSSDEDSSWLDKYRLDK